MTWISPPPQYGFPLDDGSRKQALEAFSHRASCVSAPDKSVFYSDDVFVQLDAARDWCSACPVRLDCLQYALLYNEEFGVWGGTTEIDRKSLRRKLYRKTASGVRGQEAVYRLVEYLSANGNVPVDSDVLWHIRYSSLVLEGQDEGVRATIKRGVGVVVGETWPPE